MEYAELEVGIYRLQAGPYYVELRFTDPDSTAGMRQERGPSEIDPEKLLNLRLRAKEYGGELFRQIFSDEEIRKTWIKAKTFVESRNMGLRILLRVEPNALELHALRWELLRDPEADESLTTSQVFVFSRYIHTHDDWRRISRRRKAELRALVAVSDPEDIEEFRLKRIEKRDAEAAVESLRAGDIRTELAGWNEPLTLDHLIDLLREPIDIVYLLCHGALNKRQIPRLFLQDSDGRTKVIDGWALAQRLKELPQRPRLMVLASCESAGRQESTGLDRNGIDARVALAPRLAEVGVPAVVAMQGKISMKTTRKAMAVFFREVASHGGIDRAMAAARGSVRDYEDYWMLALFIRLTDGQIWYEPGFGSGEADFDNWNTIVYSLRRSRVTCILGSGLSDNVYGSRRDLAQKLAADCNFPLASRRIDDLTSVSQYMYWANSPNFLLDRIGDHHRDEIRARHPEAVSGLPKGTELQELIQKVAKHMIGSRVKPWQWDRGSDEPYQILAELDCKVYITVSYDDLLCLALQAAGKRPSSIICNWRDSIADAEAAKPSTLNPLIFHAFGHWDDPESVVLTEDEYFDYLIRVARPPNPVPDVVGEATTNESLLFLGFSLEDWSFRVLFRRILSMEGSSRLHKRTHVAVQLDPHSHEDLINPVKAKAYLNKYFTKEANMSIYWGTPSDFLSELKDRILVSSQSRK